MELDFSKNQDIAANIISLLSTLEKIEVTDERIEQNSKYGKCNDGVVFKY